jgi:hypothetical protein
MSKSIHAVKYYTDLLPVLSGSVTFGYGYVRIILVSNVVDPDPHHFGNLDPQPHQIKKLDPYSETHQIKVRIRIRVRITAMSWIRTESALICIW